MWILNKNGRRRRSANSKIRTGWEQRAWPRPGLAGLGGLRGRATALRQGGAVWPHCGAVTTTTYTTTQPPHPMANMATAVCSQQRHTLRRALASCLPPPSSNINAATPGCCRVLNDVTLEWDAGAVAVIRPAALGSRVYSFLVARFISQPTSLQNAWRPYTLAHFTARR